VTIPNFISGQERPANNFSVDISDRFSKIFINRTYLLHVLPPKKPKPFAPQAYLWGFFCPPPYKPLPQFHLRTRTIIPCKILHKHYQSRRQFECPVSDIFTFQGEDLNHPVQGRFLLPCFHIPLRKTTTFHPYMKLPKTAKY